MKNNSETMYVMYRIKRMRRSKMLRYFSAIFFLLVAAIANVDGSSIISFLFLVIASANFYNRAILASNSKKSSQEMVDAYNDLSPDELTDAERTLKSVQREIEIVENTNRDVTKLNNLYTKLLVLQFVTIFRLKNEAEAQK